MRKTVPVLTLFFIVCFFLIDDVYLLYVFSSNLFLTRKIIITKPRDHLLSVCRDGFSHINGIKKLSG